VAGGFEQYDQDQLRIPHRGPTGLALAAAIGREQDNELSLLRVALRSRTPWTCPDDALDALGAWYRLPRYPGEPNGTAPSAPVATDGTGYRSRLCNAWETWEKAGSAEGLEDQIRAAFPGLDVRIYTTDEGCFGPDPRGSYSRFWIFLGPNYGGTGIRELLLGSFTLGGTTTLGTTATRAQIVLLKKVILRWKATHGYPVKVVLLFGSGPVLGIGMAGGAKPLTLGTFILGRARVVAWPIGRTLNDTLPTLGSFVLGDYEI
jgi:hypothetical protein